MNGEIDSLVPGKPRPPEHATLDDAIALAVEAHRGVKDKSGQPYILHPCRVMFRCETEIEMIVAVLHDVVEDTDRSFDDLRKLGYSEDVIAALDGVTKREGESYEQFVERASMNPVSRRVKIADIEDNMDMRRLPSVGPKDWDRMTKYLSAWRRLIGAEGRKLEMADIGQRIPILMRVCAVALLLAVTCSCLLWFRSFR